MVPQRPPNRLISISRDRDSVRRLLASGRLRPSTPRRCSTMPSTPASHRTYNLWAQRPSSEGDKIVHGSSVGHETCRHNRSPHNSLKKHALHARQRNMSLVSCMYMLSTNLPAKLGFHKRQPDILELETFGMSADARQSLLTQPGPMLTAVFTAPSPSRL